VLEILLKQEENLFRINRFHNIFIASRQISFSLALFGRVCCKHQNRDILSILAEYPDAFYPVDQGYKEIHEDKIYLLIFPAKVIDKFFAIVENPDISS